LNELGTMTRGIISLVIVADIFHLYISKSCDFYKIAPEFMGRTFFVQDFSEKNLAAFYVIIDKLRFLLRNEPTNFNIKKEVSF
jgi:hypothetical protein